MIVVVVVVLDVGTGCGLYVHGLSCHTLHIDIHNSCYKGNVYSRIIIDVEP